MTVERSASPSNLNESERQPSETSSDTGLRAGQSSALPETLESSEIPALNQPAQVIPALISQGEEAKTSDQQELGACAGATAEVKTSLTLEMLKNYVDEINKSPLGAISNTCVDRSYSLAAKILGLNFDLDTTKYKNDDALDGHLLLSLLCNKEDPKNKVEPFFASTPDQISKKLTELDSGQPYLVHVDSLDESTQANCQHYMLLVNFDGKWHTVSCMKGIDPVGKSQHKLLENSKSTTLCHLPKLQSSFNFLRESIEEARQQESGMAIMSLLMRLTKLATPDAT